MVIIYHNVSKTVLWQKTEVTAKCDVNYDSPTASNQHHCQQLCEAKKTCIGISFGYSGITAQCRICEDDKLASSDIYDFYRRPGDIIFSLAYFYLVELDFLLL